VVLVDFFWQNRVGTLDRVYLNVIATRCGGRVDRGLFWRSWCCWGMGYGDGSKYHLHFVGYLIKPNLLARLDDSCKPNSFIVWLSLFFSMKENISLSR